MSEWLMAAVEPLTNRELILMAVLMVVLGTWLRLRLDR